MTIPSKIQCKACPWRKDVVPARDIPNGYSAAKHCGLRSTIAKPGELSVEHLYTVKVMACHESPVGKERACVGWAVHQLGPGNNIGLRLQAMKDRSLQNLKTVGQQHGCFEDTLPKK